MNDLLINRSLIFQTSYAWDVRNKIGPEFGKQELDDKVITGRNSFVYSLEPLGHLHHQHVGVSGISPKLTEGNWQSVGDFS